LNFVCRLKKWAQEIVARSINLVKRESETIQKLYNQIRVRCLKFIGETKCFRFHAQWNSIKGWSRNQLYLQWMKFNMSALESQFSRRNWT
jgi:hypothetical protein